MSDDIDSSEGDVTIRRTIDAPREHVWDALTDPEEMKRWYGADLMEVQIHTFEAEPGGSFSVTMDDGENRYDIDGRIVDVVEYERLVHTWYVGRVTFELDDVDDRTAIVLTHEDLPDRETADQHETGWVAALEALAIAVERRRND